MNYIVLVNWNGASDLVECLESLSRLRGEFCVVVADNGSTDESLASIRNWSCGELTISLEAEAWDEIRDAPRRELNFVEKYIEGEKREAFNIYWLPLGRNAGFAVANNEGMRFAFSDLRAGCVWLLNTDTIVHPDALKELLARAHEVDTPGLVGSTLCFYRQPETLQALGVHFSLVTFSGREIHRGQRRLDLPSREVVEDRISYVVGASMLVSREFYVRVGSMSEDYFLYFEEIDWAVRSRGRFKLAWAPRSIVFHKEGGSIGTNADARPSDTSIYYMTVNALRFSTKFAPYLVPVALARLLVRTGRFAVKGDSSAVKMMKLAFFDWIQGLRREGPVGQFKR